MTVYGYARVSTTGQTLDIQLALLQGAKCDRVFSEKVSGASTERPELQCLLRALKPSDMVVVTRLDRFARSARDLLNLMELIQRKQAVFRSLAEAIDISSPLGQLLLTIMGAIAQFERTVIYQRTLEGRIRAAECGIVFGRRPKLDTAQKECALARRAAGEPHKLIADTYHVSCSTISRLKAPVFNLPASEP
jgi:DNA invertase Pin-like site-specific DNA recombinase